MTARFPSLAPVLADLLRQAVAARASDLHVAEDAPPMVRVNGRLTPAEGAPLAREVLAAFADTLPGGEREAALAHRGDVTFSFTYPDLGRFRVHLYRQHGKLAAAIRVIPLRVPTLSQLDVPPILAELTRRSWGLILVAGPATSGKSTTLAALVDHINRDRCCLIITVEDPIEYVYHPYRSLVHQREVGADTSSFRRALKAALRQDPDVIAVSEQPDVQTLAVALAAAETGHLVLAGVESPPSASTASARLIDAFPPDQQPQVRMQLADALLALVVQVLVPRAAGEGQVAAYEVLVGTQAVRAMIREGKLYQLDTAIQTGARSGMRSLDQSLRLLLEAGTIAQDEFNRLTAERAEA